MTTAEQDRLDRIEARLERIEETLSRFHDMVAPVIANPGRVLAKLMGGGK